MVGDEYYDLITGKPLESWAEQAMRRKSPDPMSPADVEGLLKKLRDLLKARTEITDEDLMRYEHGGGRWAKLRDGERKLIADFYNEEDREYIVAAALSLPALLALIERLTADRENWAKTLPGVLEADERISQAMLDNTSCEIANLADGLAASRTMVLCAYNDLRIVLGFVDKIRNALSPGDSHGQ
jgi:hypothetical protein